MMKKLLSTTMFAAFSFALFAQSETDTEAKEGGFKKENLFTGGNVNISFFSGGTVLGATPQLGYAFTNWLNAGISTGYTYISQRDNIYNTKLRQSIIAPGAFARIFPLDFLFITAHYEHNFLRLKSIYADGSSFIYKDDVNTLLAGLGYTNGRQGKNSPYYYFSVSFDILNRPNSPYNDVTGNIFPVINAGFNIPLFQGGGRRRR